MVPQGHLQGFLLIMYREIYETGLLYYSAASKTVDECPGVDKLV